MTSPTVLLIEDDPTIATEITRVLSSSGGAHCTVWQAESALDARAVLRQVEDSAWALAEPWRPLLERAAKSGAAAEDAVKRDLEARLQNEPGKGRASLIRVRARLKQGGPRHTIFLGHL